MLTARRCKDARRTDLTDAASAYGNAPALAATRARTGEGPRALLYGARLASTDDADIR